MKSFEIDKTCVFSYSFSDRENFIFLLSILSTSCAVETILLLQDSLILKQNREIRISWTFLDLT